MKTTKKAPLKKAVTKKSPAYTATVTFLGKTYSAKGESVVEAITNLKPAGVAKTKTLLVISDGKVTKERVLMPFVVNRLFNLSPTMRQIAIKQVTTLFGL